MEHQTHLVKHFYPFGRYLNYLGFFSFEFGHIRILKGFSDCQWSVAFFSWICTLTLIKLIICYLMYFHRQFNTHAVIKFSIVTLNNLIHPVITFLCRKAFVKLIFEIEFFDMQAELLKHFNIKPFHGKNYKTYLIVLMVTLLITFKLFFAIFQDFGSIPPIFRNPLSPEQESYWFTLRLASFWIICTGFFPFIFPFIYFSHEISLRLKRFNESFCLAMIDSCSEASFESYRLMYFQLLRALDEFNAYFGSQVVLFFLISFLWLLTYLGEAVERSLAFLSIFVVLKILLEVYTVSKFCEEMKKEVCNHLFSL